MRKPTYVLLFTLVASLFTGSAAHAAVAAHPIKNADSLTKNALYASGRLPGSACPEPPVEAGNVASVRNYLIPLVKCLDRTWAAQFKKAGLPFSEPSVKFITRPQRVCGDEWSDDTQALYCDSNRQITFMLDKRVVDNPGDLFLLVVIAHEYGHHLQNLAGIAAALDRLPSQGKDEYNEQTRRHELQAECLSGVFVGSVWPSLKRTAQDWKIVMEDERRSGDEGQEVRDHGKGDNVAAWLERGFKAVSPAACNTWAAGSESVA